MKTREGRCRVVLALALALFVLVNPPPCAAGEVTFRNAAGETFTLPQMLPRLRAARFLILGEVHGSYRHHAVQIELLRLLGDAGVPLAVGMETFSPAATPELVRWTSGNLDSAPLYRLFEKEWNLSNWPAYRDLLYFLRERRIPLRGINAEEVLIQRVASGGIASLSEPERRGLPPGGCRVDQRYRDLLERVVGVGEAHNGRFGAFCEAQTLRDSIMARNLDALGRENPGRLVVGMAGLYHAWKPAVPAHLAQLGADRVVVILPEEGPPRVVAELRSEVDYLWQWRD
jgi:uncharacterized iron-regulated protein